MAEEPPFDRRAFARLSGQALLTGGLAAAFGAQQSSPQAPATRSTATRPNILVIMTDQQRFSSLPCYGVHAIEAPNFSRLAREGVVFERCCINNTICTPSRASIWTGKTLPAHGVYRLYDNLPDDQVLVTKYLQDAGYHTALFGKLHVSGHVYEASRRHPNDGFDIFEWCMESSLDLNSPFNGYRLWLERENPALLDRLYKEGRKVTHIPRRYHMTHWAAERTIEFIHNSNASRPFFCLMSVFDPHNPYDGYPSEMERLVDRDRIPKPEFTPGESANKPYGVRFEHEHSYLGPFRKFSPRDLEQMRFGYFASIALADLEIGRVLSALAEKGIAENTLVIFTSDHGDMLGDHELFAKGAFFYDSCSRVPLLMRWPARFRAGLRVPHIAQSNDIAATVLAAAGCLSGAIQRNMPESYDLGPLCRGETAPVRDYAVCCYRNSGVFDSGHYADPPIHATMLQDSRFKLNYYHAPVEADSREGELYDMRNDPWEHRNLWTDPGHREVRLQMIDTLFTWMARQELLLGSRGGEMIPKKKPRPAV